MLKINENLDSHILGRIKIVHFWFMHICLIFLYVFLSSCSNDKENSNGIDTLGVLLSDTFSLFDLDSGAVVDVGVISRNQFFGDLDSMIHRGYIRVLVPMNRTHYFLDGARQRGVIYEEMKQFEKYINKKIKRSKNPVIVICIPTRRDQIFPHLLNGYGDIASAGLTITEERSDQVDFCKPLSQNVSEVIVAWNGASSLSKLEDLSGKSVFVRRSSTYYRHLIILNQSLHTKGFPLVNIEKADENLETEDILELVNSGLVPYTIADDYLVNIWNKVLDSLVVYDSIPLHTGGSLAHAVRKSNPNLRKMIDEFIASHGRGTTFGNVIYNRYLDENVWIKKPISKKKTADFERFLGLFKKYGERYDIDYIFLGALAYQESRFNQNVRSGAGAVGIMQVLPKTAAAPPINIKDISSIENNIHAGTKYLRHLMDTYFTDSSLTDLERLYFTMASYNAGPTRISKLRKKASGMGYDPNQWFDNVEVLVAREVGREPVNYVTNILKNYIVYKSMAERFESRKKVKEKFEDKK